jgi:hypothetical protein
MDLIRLGCVLLSAFSAQIVVAQDLGPEHVLVVYSRNFRDADSNGVSDSRDCAEYYALRRGVPAQNLLGVQVTDTGGVFTGTEIDYRILYDSVLTPVYQKLQSYDGGTQFKNKIYCIAPMYGMPLGVLTHEPSMYNDIGLRVLDQWLVNVDENYTSGYEYAGDTCKPAGTVTNSTSHGWVNHVTATNRQTFRAARDANRTALNIYLVTRLDGSSLMNAKSLVDKALYGERYLKNYSGQPTHPYYGVAVLDHDPGQDAGHLTHLYNSKLWFEGKTAGSPFAATGTWGTWDVVLDAATSEIGESGARAQLAVRVAYNGVDTARNVLTMMWPTDAATFRLIDAGRVFVNTTNDTVVVESVNYSQLQFKVDTVAGIIPGRWLYSYSTPQVLMPEALWYYGYYTFKGAFDVYKFKVGAVGFHMDSGSGMGVRNPDGGCWSSMALKRNLTATGGAITEPFASGIQYGDWFWIPFSYGMSFAEASFNSVASGTRWMCMHVGDPLYAPLRSTSKPVDATAPVIGLVQTRRSGADTGRTLCINLAGGSPDRDVEVAQFKIEYGLSAGVYDTTIDYDWGWQGTLNGTWKSEKERHFFFARQYEWTLDNLRPAAVYHYRVTARDQFGNTSATGDMVFSTSAASDTGFDITRIADGYPALDRAAAVMTMGPLPMRGRLAIVLHRSVIGDRTALVSIYNLRGQMVRQLPVTASRLEWAGRDQAGRRAANGGYTVRAVIDGRSWCRSFVRVGE